MTNLTDPAEPWDEATRMYTLAELGVRYPRYSSAATDSYLSFGSPISMCAIEGYAHELAHLLAMGSRLRDVRASLSKSRIGLSSFVANRIDKLPSKLAQRDNEIRAVEITHAAVRGLLFDANLQRARAAGAETFAVRFRKGSWHKAWLVVAERTYKEDQALGRVLRRELLRAALTAPTPLSGTPAVSTPAP